MANRRFKTDDLPEVGSRTPAWMTTFSDLSTLLLSFFVLLLSMSSMDKKNIKNMFHNFATGGGMFFFKEYGEVYRPKATMVQGLKEILGDSLVITKTEDKRVDENSVIAPASTIEEGKFKDAGNTLTLENFKGGFKLVFGHKLLFRSGSAEITDEMKPVLGKIGAFIRNSDYQVYIDGHTDNVPLRGSAYASNEDLSLARAYNLFEHLVKMEKAPAYSVALSGYGDLHPMDSPHTLEGRSKNRRVEMIFKSQRYF